jgi:hypothetical protein
MTRITLIIEEQKEQGTLKTIQVVKEGSGSKDTLLREVLKEIIKVQKNDKTLN